MYRFRCIAYIHTYYIFIAPKLIHCIFLGHYRDGAVHIYCIFVAYLIFVIGEGRPRTIISESGLLSHNHFKCHLLGKGL